MPWFGPHSVDYSLSNRRKVQKKGILFSSEYWVVDINYTCSRGCNIPGSSGVNEDDWEESAFKTATTHEHKKNGTKRPDSERGGHGVPDPEPEKKKNFHMHVHDCGAIINPCRCDKDEVKCAYCFREYGSIAYMERID